MSAKSFVISIVVSFLSGVLLSAAVTTGYYFGKLNSDRQEYRSVTEKLERAVGETEQIRTEISKCRDIVEDSTRRVQEIRDASGKIREQVKILQDYYDSTGRILSDLTGNEYNQEY